MQASVCAIRKFSTAVSIVGGQNAN